MPTQPTTHPATPAQSGMIFHSLSAPGTGVEIEQVVVSTEEPLDREALREAWRVVVERHPALRTSFRWQGLARPRAVVAPVATAPPVRSLGGRTMEEILAEDRAVDFDLGQPPMRLGVRQEGSRWSLLWSFHHAILDGRSFPVVLDEVFRVYEALRVGSRPSLPPPPPDFGDFARHVDERRHEDTRFFWTDAFQDLRAPDYPFPTTRSHRNSGRFGAVELRLSTDRAAELERFARGSGWTFTTLLQAAWSLVLANRSWARDVVFGGTRACRHGPVEGSGEMVGLLINTLPMRAAVDRGVGELLDGLRRLWVDMRPHELTPLSEALRWIGSRDLDSIVVYDSLALGDRLAQEYEGWEERDVVYRGCTGYPLTLIGYGGAEPLLRLEHDLEVVDRQTGAELLDETRTALAGLPGDAGRPARSVSVLSEERLAVELDRARPERSYDVDPAAIPARLRTVWRERGSGPAVSGPDGTLTFRELWARSGRIASGLVDRGVSGGDRVAVMTDRRAGTVATLLGVLRAGAVYVPVDPGLPPARVTLILEDSGASLLVGDPAVDSGRIPRIGEDELAGGAPSELPDIDADAPAYVIYTSGSTGRPKGVVVTHRNVTRLANACADRFSFSGSEHWSCYHSFGFDFSVWETWCALLYGARVTVLADEVIRDPRRFAETVRDEGIAVVSLTPTAFRQALPHLAQGGAGSALRYVVLGGEAFEPSSARTWFDTFGDGPPYLVNMYGITETTVHVTFHVVDREDMARASSPIGNPLPDLGILTLNEAGTVVPPGAPGEMYVTGDGVSRGYLGRPDLTARRFVEPEVMPGRRFYRTGDLARRRADGVLEFLGRADAQVKVRGYRIEPGEIEHALREHRAIADTAVVVRTAGDAGADELVAYLVPRGEAPSPSELRHFLAQALPSYMVPVRYVVIDALPRTLNGKLDLEALPEPGRDRPAVRERIAPSTAMERTVAAAWSSVLGLEHVGIRDNFFDIGGDSIKAMVVVDRLRRELDREMQVVWIFEEPTVEALARRLDTEETASGREALGTRGARQRQAFLRMAKDRG